MEHLPTAQEIAAAEADTAKKETEHATGMAMDAATMREEWLCANRERILSDDRLFLYRLPLTPEQLDRLHAQIMSRPMFADIRESSAVCDIATA